MAPFESAVEIERPVDPVYKWFLAMDENAPRVDPEADEARKHPSGDTGPGTVFTLRRGSRESTVTFTAMEPNQWIDFETKIGPMRPTARLSFEPTAAGTRLSIRADSNVPGFLRFLEPLANRMGKREWDKRLERICEDLETDR